MKLTVWDDAGAHTYHFVEGKRVSARDEMRHTLHAQLKKFDMPLQPKDYVVRDGDLKRLDKCPTVWYNIRSFFKQWRSWEFVEWAIVVVLCMLWPLGLVIAVL